MFSARTSSFSIHRLILAEIIWLSLVITRRSKMPLVAGEDRVIVTQSEDDFEPGLRYVMDLDGKVQSMAWARSFGDGRVFLDDPRSSRSPFPHYGLARDHSQQRTEVFRRIAKPWPSSANPDRRRVQ